MMTQGKVYLIGAGPGDAELLTLKALRLLKQADAVVYDRLVSPEILALAPEGARMIPVGKAPHNHPVPQDRINEILADLALRGLTVARLKGGDPLIFGRGSEEAAHLRALGIDVEYVPGITAAQGAAAATGIPLTHRGLASGVQYITGHRQADRPLDMDWHKLADPDTTLIVYMGVANIGEIALRLMAAGMPASLPVMAIANATTARETRLLASLGDIAPKIRRSSPDGPVLFVIGHVVSLYQQLDTESLIKEAPADMVAAVAHA